MPERGGPELALPTGLETQLNFGKVCVLENSADIQKVIRLSLKSIGSSERRPSRMILDVLTSTIVDSLTSGVLAVDLEGRVLFVNTALAHRLGIDRNAAVGKPALALFGTLNPRTSVKRSPMYAFRRRDDPKIMFREVEWSDGKRIVHLREDSSPLHDESGHLIGRLFAYHDLSWEKTVDQHEAEYHLHCAR